MASKAFVEELKLLIREFDDYRREAINTEGVYIKPDFDSFTVWLFEVRTDYKQ